ncbi:hypothetical protein INO34_14590, partial [Staphylococcus aureus]|nr:hypothetical protein [Staphylococcus aureus]
MLLSTFLGTMVNVPRAYASDIAAAIETIEIRTTATRVIFVKRPLPFLLCISRLADCARRGR